MSREIKFRGWSNGKIEYSGKMPSFGFWKWAGYDSSTIIMQFTGIHDKNGKEIYEGDILKHDIWGITKVYWENGSFWADNSKQGDEFKEIRLGDQQLQRTRVIGNIYQNPELLRGGENNAKTNKK